MIKRRDRNLLSDPDQSSSENEVILVYQNLYLYLIKCTYKATILLRSLVFWMPTLWLFECNVFGTSSARFLELWLTNIGLNLADKNRQIWLVSIKIAKNAFAEIMYKCLCQVLGEEANTT